MRFVLRSMLVGVAAMAIAAAVYGQEDVAGSKDYPGVTRMPPYYIYEYQERPFDTFTFKVKSGQRLEGPSGRRAPLRFPLQPEGRRDDAQPDPDPAQLPERR